MPVTPFQCPIPRLVTIVGLVAITSKQWVVFFQLLHSWKRKGNRFKRRPMGFLHELSMKANATQQNYRNDISCHWDNSTWDNQVYWDKSLTATQCFASQNQSFHNRQLLNGPEERCILMDQFLSPNCLW